MADLGAAKLRRIEQDLERRIREMRDSGALSGLPGEGQPLPADPDSEAGDAWAARHVMRTSGARPEWAGLRRDIAGRRWRIVARFRAHLAWLDGRSRTLEHLPAERVLAEVAATRRRDDRLRAELASALDEMNALIRRHNLLVTAASLHLPIATAEHLMEIARYSRGSAGDVMRTRLAE